MRLRDNILHFVLLDAYSVNSVQFRLMNML